MEREAYTNMRYLFDSEITHYRGIKDKNKRQFVSAPKTPLGKAGKDKRKGNWDQPSWETLGFDPKQPVRFTYWVTTKGAYTEASFEVWAEGDVDGNGKTCKMLRASEVNEDEEMTAGMTRFGDCHGTLKWITSLEHKWQQLFR